MSPQATSTLGAEMLEALSTYLKDFKEAFAAARNLPLPDLKGIDHVVLSGMGGSGIGASLVAALARDTAPKPIVVLKDYHVPGFVGPKTLVIATSYSGSTEETLYSVGAAAQRGAKIVGIASQGPLAAYCAKKKAPLYTVPKDRQPRAALPFLFGALAGMFDRLGLASLKLDPQDENILQNRHVQVQPRLAASDDAALRLADVLRNTRPVFCGEGHLYPVAVRWKCQFNENAKLFARAEPLPEMNHNDLVAWSQAPKIKQDTLVLLRRPKEPREVEARFDFLADAVKAQKVPVQEIRAEAKTPLGQCLEHLLVADYTSVYTAILRRVDPIPVPIIKELKDRLATQGLASEAKRLLGL